MNKKNNLEEYLKRRKAESTFNWKCTICGEIFKSRRDMQKHRKITHNFKYGDAWNKGLTVDTDERVRKYRNTLKKHIEEGIVKFGHKISDETKEKISLLRSQQLNDIGPGGFKNIKWYKIKNIAGAEFTVRGTWELLIAKRLNEQNILWIRNKWIEYIDNIKRHYNTDFYLPNSNEYIEVKGYYSDKDKRKMKLVIEQHPELVIYFINSDIFYSIEKDSSLSIIDKNYLLKLESFE